MSDLFQLRVSLSKAIKCFMYMRLTDEQKLESLGKRPMTQLLADNLHDIFSRELHVVQYGFTLKPRDVASHDFQSEPTMDLMLPECKFVIKYLFII